MPTPAPQTGIITSEELTVASGEDNSVVALGARFLADHVADGGPACEWYGDEVVAELEAQQAAAEEADKAARKAIREQKNQERKETVQQRADALKAKFHK